MEATAPRYMHLLHYTFNYTSIVSYKQAYARIPHTLSSHHIQAMLQVESKLEHQALSGAVSFRGEEFDRQRPKCQIVLPFAVLLRE